MALNLDSLKKSIGVLRHSIQTSDKHSGSGDKDLEITLRAGVIQNFEVAYEQSWKMIQRWIKENKSTDEAENPRTRKELFRQAALYGLISDPIPWFTYGEARNLSSHTYDEEKAISVYETAKQFLPDSEWLLQRLDEMND